MELKYLFSPQNIGTVQIKNRIIRSATAENMAENGHPSDQLINLYNELAEGGVGLIITGGISVDPSSTFSKKGTSLHTDEFISSHKKLVDIIHDNDAKIAAQIGHTGRQSSNKRYEAVAPSAITYPQTGRTPRALTTDEIKDIIKMFIECGRRAFESEYDMVQLHAAHGYLLSSFLTPYTNKRTDEFGEKSISNRTKILVDIYNGIRDEVGSNFPIIVKLQTHEGDLIGGLPLDEGLEIAKKISDAGFDAIEPSGGGGDLVGADKFFPSVQIESPEDENYFLPAVKGIRALTDNCTLILMGGIRNPLSAEKVIQDGITEFIAMSRPLIYEPDLPNRWKSGDHTPAFCESCNSCYFTIFNDTLECTMK